jgi:hypothetical protein
VGSRRFGELKDFQGWLEKLQAQGGDVELLKILEGVIADRGSVEFRTTPATILDRLSERNFEIAVFGRVSSGKSSLLNAILASDVLPAGVTPITSVPTRGHGKVGRSGQWCCSNDALKCSF